MGTRRAQGEGAIHYDETRQRWIGRLDIGVTVDGKRKRITVSAPTKNKATQLLRERRRELDGGTATAHGRMTFAALAGRWLLVAAPERVDTEATLVNYGRLLDLASETIGAVRVDQLTADHIDAMLDGLAARFSKAYVTKARQVVTQTIRWGIARGYLTRDPTIGVAMPRSFQPGRPQRSLTIAEAKAVVAAAHGRRLGPLVLVMLVTGARPGEATTLEWSDLDGDTLTIRQAWKDTGGARRLGSPKGNPRRSVRALVLPAELVAELGAWRAAQAAERLAAGGSWPDQYRELMFTTTAGTPLEPRNLRRLVDAIGTEADVDDLNPYMLRHTATSAGADAGVSSTDLSDALGHTDTRMVDHHYRHRLTPAAAPGSVIL